MEVLLFALFFIVALIFFIAGKDDFGRKESELMFKGKVKKDVKNELATENKDKIKNELATENKDELKEEVELESS